MSPRWWLLAIVIPACANGQTCGTDSLGLRMADLLRGLQRARTAVDSTLIPPNSADWIHGIAAVAAIVGPRAACASEPLARFIIATPGQMPPARGNAESEAQGREVLEAASALALMQEGATNVVPILTLTADSTMRRVGNSPAGVNARETLRRLGYPGYLLRGYTEALREEYRTFAPQGFDVTLGRVGIVNSAGSDPPPLRADLRDAESLLDSIAQAASRHSGHSALWSTWMMWTLHSLGEIGGYSADSILVADAGQSEAGGQGIASQATAEILAFWPTSVPNDSSWVALAARASKIFARLPRTSCGAIRRFVESVAVAAPKLGQEASAGCP